jgi:cobalamin biosynthesis Mg chelatase CobN
MEESEDLLDDPSNVVFARARAMNRYPGNPKAVEERARRAREMIKWAQKVAEMAQAKKDGDKGGKGQASSGGKRRNDDRKQEAANANLPSAANANLPSASSSNSTSQTSSSSAGSEGGTSPRINPDAITRAEDKPKPAEVASAAKPSTKESQLPLGVVVIAGAALLYFLFKE